VVVFFLAITAMFYWIPAPARADLAPHLLYVATAVSAAPATGMARDDQADVHKHQPAPVSTAPAREPGIPHAVIPTPGGPHRNGLITIMLVMLSVIVGLISIYAVRHYTFTLNRLFGIQRHPYLDIDTADWPPVTVLIPAHNEAAVISQMLEALLAADYPSDRLHVIPVNDRSTDHTGEILDDFARRYPGRIEPWHRREGKAGKAAVLKDAMPRVNTEIMLVFDADYIPGKGLIKQLVAPFFDPEVGASMGRVVPHNVDRSVLTRLLDLERSGGYQVDQQARMNLHLVPQYGGTVGGVRVNALHAVGGWDDDALAEDTDLTYRLLLGGWKTAYQNRSECYEEVPECWDARLRQVRRWAKGHNYVTARYTVPLLRSRRVRLFEKIDGLLLLGVYFMSPILLLGWILAITLFYLGAHYLSGAVAILAITSYGALGNFAAFFEIAAALRLDGRREATTLLPLNLMSFLVGMVCISRASLSQLLPKRYQGDLTWDKTERYRGKE
jgi:cellulose synthase/poly-beta-1,6-N-acetylglucosamine synthase-like glycosyltransferase